MTLIKLLSGAALAALLCGPAAAAITRSGLRVEPVDATRFIVYPKGAIGESDLWCAAAQFARRQGLPAAGRIWRVTPPPMGGGRGVMFSLSPEDSSGRTGVMTLGGRRDGSFNRSFAEQFCWNPTEDRD
ncbi:hypothetical protein CDV50_05200 [Haematobacter massiliensis]|uniref:hypothetical protein n=1 Tax=Haematobacter massiliensis TaxID=195105 RepID=UPI00068F2B84|nr:hypothetical protein [Haematobacter massiliensis]OWJ72564.1 hypothetical protein CDV50_05200 [Haematobacter massiliensis]OWJ87903.1 hypothetical protein CDV51_05020 [Haematobacter massiliensis]QBJ24342.1 hypothetical protein HmaOT1_08795 [Haematobacter massiliensis]